MRIILLLLQIFFLFSLLSCSIIPTEINKKIPGWETYTATINIGTPNLPYKLQVNFDYDKIIIWEKLPSSSYSKKLGGSDYIYVGGKYLRVNIIEDKDKKITIDDTHCWDCKGILGLAPSSIFWKIWPDISFSRSRITLGKVGSEIGWGEEKSLNVINCVDYENFCKTRASIRYKNTLIEDIILIFDPSSQNLDVPDYIYDEYTSDINIYGGDISRENNDIVIEVDFDKDEEGEGKGEENKTLSTFKKVMDHWKTDLKLNKEKIGTNVKINIKSSQLVCTNKDRGKNFYLKRNAPGENYIKLGTLALKSQIFHKYEEYMLIQSFSTNDVISIQNLIFFGIQLILSIRWKITHLAILVPFNEGSNDNSLMNIIYELFGVAITIISFVLPSTLNLMNTHKGYYNSTAVVIAVSLFIKIVIWIDEIRKRINDLNNNSIASKTETKNLSFERYFFRSFSQEVILLTGMWILVLEDRVEDLDSFLILITNVFLLYTTGYYTIILLHYIIVYLFDYSHSSKFPTKRNVFYYYPSLYTSSNSDIWKFRGFAFLAFFIFGYQSIVTVNFFLRPLFIKNFEEYQHVIVPGLVFLYLFIFIVSSLIVGLLLEKEKSKILKKEKKEKEEKKNSKNSTVGKLKNKNI